MGRLLFDLTDEDRALLERHRVRLGLRSHAETLRALIRDYEPDELPAPRLTDDQRKQAQAAYNRMMSPVFPQPSVPKPSGDFGPVRAKPGALLKKR